MHKYLSALALGVLALLGLAYCIPMDPQPVERPNNAKALDVRSDFATCATNQPSVYICQNYNWEAPCLSFCLSPEDNNQQLFWMAPVPGGPGPFQDSNWTIGSWGPSQGVTTYWVDEKNDYSQWYEYPGTGGVDDYWKQNVWTWYAFWS